MLRAINILCRHSGRNVYTWIEIVLKTNWEQVSCEMEFISSTDETCFMALKCQEDPEIIIVAVPQMATRDCFQKWAHFFKWLYVHAIYLIYVF